jgi:alkanesulfonate monooxygenase SsuD/methylene tetrahydromethanopterin reductase-like flavin-dependent oxidoreductase (luciferase family)
MDVGIGLPAASPDIDRESFLDWAQRAERCGFSSLAASDRLVFSNYEPLIALAGAAAVTETIRLTTNIVIVPYRVNAPLLAKQAATIDLLSHGRLTLGVGIGGCADDYQASGVSIASRGERMDAMLAELKACWTGAERGFAGPVGPPPARNGGPELLIGGRADACFRRVAEFGDGWTMGFGTPDMLTEGARRTREEWTHAGREGKPRIVALCYFALGDRARDTADAYLKHFYAIAGEEFAGHVARSAVIDEEMARAYRDAFAASGADELFYLPCSTDPGQVELLAEAVLSEQSPPPATAPQSDSLDSSAAGLAI